MYRIRSSYGTAAGTTNVALDRFPRGLTDDEQLNAFADSARSLRGLPSNCLVPPRTVGVPVAQPSIALSRGSETVAT